VLLITTPTEDGKHNLKLYIEAFRNQYESIGATVSVLNLITENPSDEVVESMILSADAIYVSCGSSYLMIEEWRKRGVDKLLRQAYDNGTVMSGLSAGAIAWSKYCNPDSFYTNKSLKLDALGLINALICPHYDSENYRHDSFKNMIKEIPELVGIALDEHAAIEIVDDEYRIHSYGSGGKAYKCYWNNEKYFTKEIISVDDFKSLEELINKA
jgi:dipeptidase E